MEKEMLIHLLEKVDKVAEHVSHIRESQARTEVDVRHHIRRTDLLEEAVAMLKRQVDLLMTPVRWISNVLRWCRITR